MTGWGLAAGIIGTLGLTAWLRRRAKARQDEADANENANGIRYLIKKHPEWLRG